MSKFEINLSDVESVYKNINWLKDLGFKILLKDEYITIDALNGIRPITCATIDSFTSFCVGVSTYKSKLESEKESKCEK